MSRARLESRPIWEMLISEATADPADSARGAEDTETRTCAPKAGVWPTVSGRPSGHVYEIILDVNK